MLVSRAKSRTELGCMEYCMVAMTMVFGEMILKELGHMVDCKMGCKVEKRALREMIQMEWDCMVGCCSLVMARKAKGSMEGCKNMEEMKELKEMILKVMDYMEGCMMGNCNPAMARKG